MCCNSNCKGCICVTAQVYKWILIIGGLNWGLEGLGMLFNSMKSWNLIKMIFSSMPMVEVIVYIIFGIVAVMYAFGCRCNKCKKGVCSVCVVDNKMENVGTENTQGKM